MCKNALYVGELENLSLQSEKIEGSKTRVTIRFKQEDHEMLDRLAFALDVTPSKATAILLDVSVRNSHLLIST
ncbi:hypothetical protein CR203_23675 [Salipaludibacillus neizhouensis]|uniref:Uncharacterized protein n=1 Tax=Salipaludibacillus neizhouensis TaxID=885475 RepID=A0A3A9K5F0_9BACI|nr:hypothetical protein [Salipaludibacillus neizhouensis]RKL64903.1 hypothetical protein CR203_23675 [Salipaludibacillus neizhouensis]